MANVEMTQNAAVRNGRRGRKPTDLVGRRFGRLVVLRITPLRRRASPVWECSCDCGNSAFVAASNLFEGGTRSCGCLRSEASKSRVQRYLKRNEHTCAHCSVSFLHSATKAVKYCSSQCREKAASARYRASLAAKQCVCGSKFSPKRPTQVYCSTSCERRVSHAKKRAHRQTQIRGGERIDPFVVFSRDRWTCQLCGVKTPKNKRGKHKVNSPELDHVVPISRGGLHVMTNVQCACRQCNMRKGASVLGQLRLFG